MSKILFNRKPVSQTVLGKVAAKYALKRAGIETRTPEQVKADEEKKKKVNRWWSIYGKDEA